jgi:hypothetical protein
MSVFGAIPGDGDGKGKRRMATPPAPTLFPRVKKEERRVFLEPERWKDLSEIAEFHTDTFKEMKVAETASRNDMIEAFLEWAAAAYWEDKGGKPKTEADRAAKVKKFAEKLRKQMPNPVDK